MVVTTPADPYLPRYLPRRRAPTFGMVAVLVAAFSTSCSVADNLTYHDITTELDSIVQVSGSGFDRRIEYADRAAVSTWYMRWPIFVPIRQLLGVVMGRTAIMDLDNPSGHVRELLRELPDEAGSDVDAGADAIARFLWVAELDPSPANRIVALDAATQVLQQLGISGMGDVANTGNTTDPARLEAARASIQLSRPSARAATGWPQGGQDGMRSAYRSSVEVLAERPLASWADRIALLGDMRELRRSESDPALRPFVGAALRRCIGHAVRGALVRAVQGRDPGRANVRLCAMQLIRRLGGPGTVPLMLAVMASSDSAVTTITERFDRDPLVQLRLIHLCGQLRGDAALQSVQLPGRESWENLAPVDFLAQTVLTERAYYSKLRVPALTALCLCLGKPQLDYEVDWVEAWYRERQRRS